jgi:hypothetical protein
MADMIDAKEAKQILGCDDDGLNNHINGGAVRAQRIGGKLMVNKEDVLKVAAEQDDGTIVLTGDSDNLQIDLGKVVDDTSETLIQINPNRNGPTDSITFGDELEVINFEDNKGTSELAFDDSKKTMDLNFTDQNTAVMTAVDETQIGATTAHLDTSNDASPVASQSSSESRRSVRSNRVRVEVAPVHPMWVAFMALTTLIMAFFITPYLVMSAWPRGEDRDAARNQSRGVDDNFWTSMASTMAGFSTEPDSKRFKAVNGADKEYVANPDASGANFRIEKYRNGLNDENEKRDSFIIGKIDGNQAISKNEKAKYPIVDVKTRQGDLEITEEIVDIGLSSNK